MTEINGLVSYLLYRKQKDLLAMGGGAGESWSISAPRNGLVWGWEAPNFHSDAGVSSGPVGPIPIGAGPSDFSPIDDMRPVSCHCT